MKLRKRWLALLCAAAAVAAVPLMPAQAVENGRPVNGDEQWAGVLTVKSKFKCSAAIIDPHWALTAAHCVDTWETTDLAFVGGAAAANSAAAAPKRVVRKITAPSGRDLALLFVSDPFQLDSYVKLPDNVEYPVNCGGQCRGRAYGWAKTGCRDNNDDKCLLGAAPIANVAEVDFNPFISSCVDSRNKSAICSTGMMRKGDSGGPLVYDRDGPRVIGINSTAALNVTAAHTNVIHDLDWIKGTMNIGVVVVP